MRTTEKLMLGLTKLNRRTVLGRMALRVVERSYGFEICDDASGGARTL
jgi:hypothetical protein